MIQIAGFVIEPCNESKPAVDVECQVCGWFGHFSNESEARAESAFHRCPRDRQSADARPGGAA